MEVGFSRRVNLKKNGNFRGLMMKSTGNRGGRGQLVEKKQKHKPILTFCYISFSQYISFWISAFHKAGKRADAVKVLEQLTLNAVVEYRYVIYFLSKKSMVLRNFFHSDIFFFHFQFCLIIEKWEHKECYVENKYKLWIQDYGINQTASF